MEKKDDVVIDIDGVSKKFARSIRWSMAHGSVDLAKNLLGIKGNKEKLRKTEFWSLRNISFQVKRGETFGLVGANGSGKTTLLRMINGIFPPDSGRLTVKGRIGALIAVGAGFHPHMTGRENIYLNGTILGLTRKQIDSLLPKIIEFADIGDFLESPVSTYSSGMRIRLGFAIAIHSNAEIILVDEILAVGDSKFKRKCLDKIEEMSDSGITFVMVSHDSQNIEGMCDRAALLHKGELIMVSEPGEIISKYESMLISGEEPTREIKHATETGSLELVNLFRDYGTHEITLKSVNAFSNSGGVKNQFDSDEPIEIRISLESPRPITELNLWMQFLFIPDKDDRKKDVAVLGLRDQVDISEGDNEISISLPITQLTTGSYSISLRLYDKGFKHPYAQGIFGFINVLKPLATNLVSGKGSPYCWIVDSKITVK